MAATIGSKSCSSPRHHADGVAAVVRAGGLEPPQVSRPYGFSYHFGFRRRAGCSGPFVVWTIPSPYPDGDVGAARLVSTPSAGAVRPRRLGSGSPGIGFPEFEQFCIAGFPASTRCRNLTFRFKSVASTNFATPAASQRLDSQWAVDRKRESAWPRNAAIQTLRRIRISLPGLK